MKKAVPRINRWLILGTAGVFLAIIFYGFDGQFFAFSDPSSLHLCFVSNYNWVMKMHDAGSDLTCTVEVVYYNTVCCTCRLA